MTNNQTPLQQLCYDQDSEIKIHKQTINKQTKIIDELENRVEGLRASLGRIETSAKAPSLTHQRLKEVIEYVPQTGLFFWKKRHGVKAGALAGSVIQGGYISIRVDGMDYLAHRLAWFYQTGIYPKRKLRHLNGDRPDNKWDNLEMIIPKTRYL